MPVKPSYTWSQTTVEIRLEVVLQSARSDGTGVDVLFTDSFLKINAVPYLLTVDLLHEINPEESKYHLERREEDGKVLIHLVAKKAEEEVVWERLSVRDEVSGTSSLSKVEILERRKASLLRAEKHYNEMLSSRKEQREVEGRRLTAAQWDVDKQQRRIIEERMNLEKVNAEEDLYTWQQQQDGSSGSSAAKPNIQSPADLLSAFHSNAPSMRHGNESETFRIGIDFTPQALAMPSRSRGDEEHYRQSRYKPVSIQDSPMFWKEKGDQYYHNREFKAAADAYSESIKRDGVFLTCVMNRAACHLQLMEWKKCVEDCSLALNILANTPSSELSQDRYRLLMCKIHSRRGAAYAWGHEWIKAQQDLRVAAAYADTAFDTQTAADLAVLEKVMSEKGIGSAANGGSGDEGSSEDAAALAAAQEEAAQMHAAMSSVYRHNYAEAKELYTAILARNAHNLSARGNRTVACLALSEFDEALNECQRIIKYCGEVALALQQSAADGGDIDSDDEETEEGDVNRDESVMRRRAAVQQVKEKSSHVYALLKAYVRGAAALCGKKEYGMALEFLQSAMQITPYDNDLMADAVRIEEKMRMEALVSVSSRAAAASKKQGERKTETAAAAAAAAAPPTVAAPAAS